ERVENFAARSDELIQGGANYRHDRAITLDIHVDVAVEIGHIQQALDVISSDLALKFQIRHFGLASAGVIAVDCAVEIRPIFDVGVRKLIGCQLLRVGKSILPLAHDDFPPSEYTPSARRSGHELSSSLALARSLAT